MADQRLVNSGAQRDLTAGGRRRRTDAEQNRVRILEAAESVLRADSEASVQQIADAAGVSRTTLHRHFRSRSELEETVRRQVREDSDANEEDFLRPAGELADTAPSPIDVIAVLNKVPPHLLGEQIVAEAQRIAGVSSVALYVVDIDGSHLLRLAGSLEYPEQIRVPLAVGPELPREGVPGLRELLDEDLPGCVSAPLYLRGRAVGVLLATQAPEAPLDELARQAAAVIDLASAYTDVFGRARRRKDTSAAAEIQQSCLPPRIVRISGATLAGNVLPGYEIGGDWFDYVDNPEGGWLGVADAKGRGTRAAGLAAVGLGAFRAARHGEMRLAQAGRLIHDTMVEVGDGAYLRGVIGRWHGPTSTFTWITAEGPPPLVVDADGRLNQLEDGVNPPFGHWEDDLEPEVGWRRIAAGERLVLYTDGLTDRRGASGEPIGIEGFRAAVRAAAPTSAAATVRALEDAVVAASSQPLDDDATLIVLVPNTPTTRTENGVVGQRP